MVQCFSATKTANLSLTFSRGSNDSPPLFLGETIVRGYNLDALALAYDAAFPVSAYTDFLYCPVYAYLRHVNGIRPRLGPRGSIGLITHKVFEELLLTEFHIASEYRIDDGGKKMKEVYRSVVCSLVEEAKKRLSDSLGYGTETDSIALELKLALSRWGNLWLQSLRGFSESSGLEGRELAKRFVPYRCVEVFTKAPEIGISGARIDVVEGHVPLEIKSWEGRWARSSGAHKLQIALLSLALEASKGFKVDMARLAYVYDIKLLEVDVNNRLREWALEIRDRALEELTRERPPRVGSCKRRCALVKYCLSADSKHLIVNRPICKHLDPLYAGGSS